MGQIEDINISLQNIEKVLKSIDSHLERMVFGSAAPEGKKLEDEIKTQPRLLTTKEASQIFSISEFELRRGFKAGIYPAFQIGTGAKYRKIKWRYDLLEETLRKIRKREENENGL